MKVFGIGSEWTTGDQTLVCTGFQLDEVGNWTVVDQLGGMWFLSEIEAMLQLNSPH